MKEDELMKILNNEIKKKKRDVWKLVIAAILSVSGVAILYYTDPMIAAGIFLLMWGNNITNKASK